MSKNILLKNSITGAIQIIFTTLLTFICIKIFITNLGENLYGIFSAITVIGNINIFTNLGLNFSLIKFISEQGRQKESDYDIIIAISILLIILIPTTLILFLFNKFFIITILNIPPDEYGQCVSFYYFILISNLLTLIGYTLNAVLDSLQKIYINNFLQLIYSSLYWGFILLVVWQGYTLFAVGLSILFSSFIWFMLVLYSFYKNWGTLIFEGLSKNYSRILKKHLSYSLKIYTSGTISFFFEPLTKIFISNFIGVSFVGYFDIALKIRTSFWSLISKVLYPLYPYIAQLNDINRISFIINDIQQKMLYAIIPLLVIIMFASKPFINLWIGLNVDIIAISVISVTCSFLVNIVGMPNYQYLMTKRVSKTIIFQLSNVISNIFVFLLLYKLIGYYAVLISFSLSMILAFVLNLYYQKKYLQSFMFDSFKYNKNLFILFAVSFLSAFFIDYLIKNDFLKITLIVTVVLSLSVFLIRHLKIFKHKDLELYFKDSIILYKMLDKILMKI